MPFQTLVTSCPFDVRLAIWLWLFSVVSRQPPLSSSSLAAFHFLILAAMLKRKGWGQQNLL